MPGAPISYPPQGYQPILPAPNPPVEPSFPPPYSFPSTSRPHSYRTSPPSSRLSRSPRPTWRERERDPSRTLPPLLPARPSTSNLRPNFWAHPDIPQQSGLTSYRSFSPEPRFTALYPPEAGLRHSLPLPPPTTLQPNPQWDERAYFPRPSSWSAQQSSQSTRPRSMSPLAPRRDSVGSSSRSYTHNRHLAERSPSIVSDPSHSRSIRSGRYDPIRSTVVPYSPNPATPRMVHQDRRPHSKSRTDRDDHPLSGSR